MGAERLAGEIVAAEFLLLVLCLGAMLGGGFALVLTWLRRLAVRAADRRLHGP